MSDDLRRGQEIQLRVETAAFEGKTVCRHNGLVIFVEGAVPGDVVIARIKKVKKNYAEARVVTITQPSPHRVDPRCRHFGVCGGCKWQHVDYATQLQFKEQHVRDAFERIGGFSDLPLLPILGAEEIYFYRNKMEFSFSDQEWTELPPVRSESSEFVPTASSPPSSDVFLGLHVPQRYDKVLDIQECHLQSELSNTILTWVRDFARRRGLSVYSSHTHLGYFRFLVIRQSKRTNEVMVNLVTLDDRPDVMQQAAMELKKSIPAVTTIVNTINSKKAQIAFGEEEKTYLGEGYIHERIGNFTFAISASSFFQTNTAQAEKLYEVAKSFGDLKKTDVVYDLYSGTGSIAIFISDSVQKVIGVESVESAVKDAQRNAAQNGIDNCTFVHGDLKDCLTNDRRWMESHRSPDVLMIDPPRSGMHPKVVDEVSALSPSRIVYISCNPTTQARDLKILCAQKYRLQRLQPVDMFPHTYHIESVALLTLQPRQRIFPR